MRPEPGNAATLEAANRLGLDARSFPLFEIAPVPWQAPQGLFDAILAGSANIFRHGGPQLSAFKSVPVMAVGATTAEAARASGFTVSHIGEGGLQPTVETLPPGHYLRLAGEDRVTLTPPTDVRIATEVVYAALSRLISPHLGAMLEQGCVVLLHSGEAARHFADECERLGIARNRIYLACLAPRIASLAGHGWADIRVATQRTDADLLALAARMCQ